MNDDSDSDSIEIFDPKGRSRRLPVDREKLKGTKISGGQGDGLSAEDAALFDPKTYLLTVLQLYASQSYLPAPPETSPGHIGGDSLDKWFHHTMDHVTGAPPDDVWAAFVIEVVNMLPTEIPEGA